MNLNLQILNRVLAQPWAIREETLSTLAQLIISGQVRERERADVAKIAPAANYVPLNDESYIAVKRQALPPVPEGLTVLLVWGILGRAWSSADRWWLDAIEVDDVTNAIAATPEGSTVVLWFRSPGGVITGIPENAAAIRAAGKNRNLVAFTDDQCASAAYWLASQCNSIIATPTADVGSIGVYIAFYDYCAYLESKGIKLELFRAGDMKGAGLPGNPLDDKVRNHLQASVAESYRQFTKDVTNMRAISKETMQGQTLKGQDARSANLVDAFIPSSAAFLAAAARGKYGKAG